MTRLMLRIPQGFFTGAVVGLACVGLTMTAMANRYHPGHTATGVILVATALALAIWRHHTEKR